MIRPLHGASGYSEVNAYADERLKELVACIGISSRACHVCL